MPVPAVSVVVPLYNKALYIRRCLESILQQTFADFEVVVIDDGSTDESGAIVLEMDDRRIRLVRQENGGEGAARNRGIAEASAGLLAFLDADDRWEKGFLEAIVALSQTYPDAGWFATGYRRCMGTRWDRELTLRGKGGASTRLVSNYMQVAREGDLVCSSNVALRRGILSETGLFPERQPQGADRDLWVRIAARHTLGYDTRVLAIYHSEAEGRVSGAPGNKTILPPALGTLRKLSITATLAERARQDALSYRDWLILKHAMGMIYGGERTEVEAFLRAADFATPGFRFRAGLLRAAMSFVPMRVIAAIRLKPVAWLWTVRRTPVLRRLAAAAEGLSGRTVVERLVAA
jgi:glycosyltransferase involved in cell wall biosynthesis